MQTYTPGYPGAYSAEAPNARSYICTGKGMVLAILKFIEGLLGLGLLVVTTTVVARQNLRYPDFPAVLGLVMVYSMLGLATAEGLGSFFLRVARRGATPIQLNHVFQAITSMIRFVLWCVVIAILGWLMIVYLGNQYGRYALSQMPFGFWFVLITVVVLEFLTRLSCFGYHRGIAQIMSHTRKELSQRTILRPPFWSGLPGKCIRLIVYWSIWIALILAVYFALTNNAFGSAMENLFSGRIASSYELSYSIGDWAALQADAQTITDTLGDIGKALGDVIQGSGLTSGLGILFAGIGEALSGDALGSLFRGISVNNISAVVLVLFILPLAWKILKAAFVLGCARDFNRNHV